MYGTNASVLRMPRSAELLGGLALLWAFAMAALPVDAQGVTAEEVGGCGDTVAERVLDADPSTYLALLPTLQPGDLLRLGAGTYASGLPLTGISGEPGRCIVIEGPETGTALFPGRDCCNTVSLRNVSYVVIRRLELDGQGRLGDGVKAEGDADWAHHVTIEEITIRGHGADQQIVGINTKCPAWNWVIRRNVIEAAGTGIYLGNSDGEDELSNSLIEHNLIVDTVGYNLQIKHQNGRATALGAPSSGITVVRHNVFSKAQNGSTGGAARPNMLVGHWPLSGPGTNDVYAIYGNFFHANPNEALFQGEGNVAFYRNLLLNPSGDAVNIQPHNDVPKHIRLVGNTVLATGAGLRVTGGDVAFEQRVVGNAAFAAVPLTGGTQASNVSDTHAAASAYLVNPDGTPGSGADPLDLFPLPGQLTGAAFADTELAGLPDADLDFDGLSADLSFRGAYGRDLGGAAWLPALEIKPTPVLFVDGFESGNLVAWSSSAP
ncbi:MAG: hypothetical protein MI919_26425 [Holophagales bacterium]|nr:hypothetical protein [Holophagales bacterium]